MNCPLKCDRLCERHETESTVEITFKYLPVLYYVLFAAIVLALLTMGALTNFVFFLTFLLYGIYMTIVWKPLQEINKAMKTKGVKVFGSKLSLNNPLRIIIDK